MSSFLEIILSANQIILFIFLRFEYLIKNNNLSPKLLFDNKEQ